MTKRTDELNLGRTLALTLNSTPLHSGHTDRGSSPLARRVDVDLHFHARVVDRLGQRVSAAACVHTADEAANDPRGRPPPLSAHRRAAVRAENGRRGHARRSRVREHGPHVRPRPACDLNGHGVVVVASSADAADDAHAQGAGVVWMRSSDRAQSCRRGVRPGGHARSRWVDHLPVVVPRRAVGCTSVGNASARQSPRVHADDDVAHELRRHGRRRELRVHGVALRGREIGENGRGGPTHDLENRRGRRANSPAEVVQPRGAQDVHGRGEEERGKQRRFALGIQQACCEVVVFGFRGCSSGVEGVEEDGVLASRRAATAPQEVAAYVPLVAVRGPWGHAVADVVELSLARSWAG